MSISTRIHFIDAFFRKQIHLILKQTQIDFYSYSAYILSWNDFSIKQRKTKQRTFEYFAHTSAKVAMLPRSIKKGFFNIWLNNRTKNRTGQWACTAFLTMNLNIICTLNTVFRSFPCTAFAERNKVWIGKTRTTFWQPPFRFCPIWFKKLPRTQSRPIRINAFFFAVVCFIGQNESVFVCVFLFICSFPSNCNRRKTFDTGKLPIFFTCLELKWKLIAVQLNLWR